MRPLDECLLKKKAGSIVTDGLVLWYDGINNTRAGHNPNATAWEDLSGNNVDLTQASDDPDANIFTFLDNCVSFRSNAPSSIRGRLQSDQSVPDSCLYVELVVQIPYIAASVIACNNPSARPSWICAISSDSTLVAGYAGNSGNVNINKYNAIRVGEISSITFATREDNLMLNGLRVGRAKTGTWILSNNDRLYLGNGAPGRPSYPFTGNIYSLRAYNHILSDDERMNNLLIDTKRFGIEV